MAAKGETDVALQLSAARSEKKAKGKAPDEKETHVEVSLGQDGGVQYVGKKLFPADAALGARVFAVVFLWGVFGLFRRLGQARQGGLGGIDHHPIVVAEGKKRLEFVHDAFGFLDV